MLSLPDFREKQIIIINNNLSKKIHFSNDNLVLKDLESNKVVNRVSCHKIFALFVVGDISLTSVFLRKSQKYGFSIIFLTRNFSFYGLLGSQTEGNFLLRKRQYKIENSLSLAKQIIYNKVDNQIALIKKIRKKNSNHLTAIEVMERYQVEVGEAENSQTLLGVEGYSSKVFFQAYFQDANWKGRKPRIKHDELNVLLDIGYTYLFNFIECNLRLYGFDVYRGFYHTLFYERKSLVCDLVEPFRCIIDQSIYRAYRLKQINFNDFGYKNHQYYLNYKNINKYTSIFFKAIIKVQDEIFRYIQSYYRSFIKELDPDQYPVFNVKC